MRTTLPNGLKILLEENHAAKVVAFQAWVGVGSVDEPAGAYGIAHVFEHMLFKGTARRGVGEIAQEVEASGGDINAWTSFDQTVFHLVMASRYFDIGLDILADAIQNSSFDPVELERELKVVLEEIKQGEDNPARVLSEALFGAAFVKHPYRRPVIGYERMVKGLTRERLLDFFRRYYVPNNITLVVVGDFDAARAQKKIAEAFAVARPGPLLRTPLVEPEQRAPRQAVLAQDVREAHVALALHIPGIRHPDTGALDLLAIILGQGDSSRLSVEVRRGRQLASEAYAYSYTPRDPGLLVVGATTGAATLEPCTDALLFQLFRLAHDEVTGEELEKARAIIESDAIYQKETVQGQARKLGFFEGVAGDLDYEREYNRQIHEATPATLRKVAARTVRAANMTLAALLPEPDAARAAPRIARWKGRLVELAERAESRAGRRSGAARGRRRAADRDVLRHVLPSGLRLLVKRDTTAPIVALRAVWMGGQRYEDERTAGINNLLAGLLVRGTRSRSGDEIVKEIEGMAAAMGGFSGRNSFGMRAEFLSRDFERGLEMVAESLLEPALAEAELQRERKQILDEIHAQEDNLTSVAFRLFAETLYRRHPYRLDLLGTARSLERLGRRRLAEYYRRHAAPGAMTLAVVGDVDSSRVVERVTALFGAAPAAAATPPEVPTEPPPERAREAVRLLAKQQAHLVVGFRGLTVTHPDRFALEVLSQVLSGQGGRLFVELRDKKGLAYRVSAFSLEGVDPGYFAVYLATSPENLAVAQAGIWEELARVRERPVGRTELDRAKKYLVGSHEISLQRRAALASSLAFHECYGLGHDEYRRYAPAILAVGAGEVQRLAGELLDPARAVVAVVRPQAAAPAARSPRAAAARSPREGKGPSGQARSRGR